MTDRARRRASRDTSMPREGGASGMASTWPMSDEPTLDQLLAEPIVQLLMRRDRTDEATIRHLLRRTAPKQVKNGVDTVPYPIVCLLHETARLWRSRYDRRVRAQLPGMTCARCAVLIHLAQHEGVSQAALAQILGIRPVTLVRLLDELEAAGFITRMAGGEDRRMHVLALTAKALPIIEDIYDLTRKTDDDLQLGISKAEVGQLRALLCHMRSNLAVRLGEMPSVGPLRTRGDA